MVQINRTKRTDIQLPHISATEFKNKLLNLAERYEHFILLDSNANFEQPYSEYGFLCAFDSLNNLMEISEIQQLIDFHNSKKDWLFGYFRYESFSVKHTSESLFFFRPRYVFYEKNEMLFASYLFEYENIDTLNQLISEILNSETNDLITKPKTIDIQPQTTKSVYNEKFESLRKHIKRGDSYEVNYCINFISETIDIEPVGIFKRLNFISPMPFAAFVKNRTFYTMSASPERFLKHTNGKCVSQPIKGTIARGETFESDQENINFLKQNLKERSENIMITDLVRNDLSHNAMRDSVKVEELCGVYSFRNLHQMISTVSGILKPDTHPLHTLYKSFPPGSMTGAPKHRTMQLIAEHENFDRNLYSGSIGYIEPNGNFDFNVVIRTIFYEKNARKLNFSVGSAVTFSSNAQNEYQECLLKAASILQTLRNK